MKSVITEIGVQKKNKDRVNIFVNGNYLFSCSTELIYRHGLKKGMQVDEKALDGIVSEDNFIKAKSDALKYIEKTYKTEKEVRDKLLTKGYDEQNIAKVISFMKEYKFIDDDRYAEYYIKDRVKSQGSSRLRYSLLRKGIDEAIINEKLNTLLSGREREAAEIMVDKKLHVLMKTEGDKQKLYKKLSDFLARNGYDFETINSVVKKSINDRLSEQSFEKAEEAQEQDSEKILELARKRYAIIIKSENDRMKQYKKLSDFLARKGYNWEEIKSAVKTVVGSESDDF